MAILGRVRPLVSVLALTLAAAGCGKLMKPKPVQLPPPQPLTIAAAPEAAVKAPMTLGASADANPDANGRPSPVVVRIYQLKTDAAFTGSDFFPLFDDDKKVLGPELISRDEFVLAPNEHKTLDISVATETRFIGAIAAFRDIRNAQWRVLLPASRKGLSVAVERARVVLSVAPAP